MDADNRVVINCGGIRHEVYKVEERNHLQNIFLVFFSINCKMFKFLCPSVNESSYNCNHLSVSLTTQSVFPSEFKATQLTFPTLRHFVLKLYNGKMLLKQKVTKASKWCKTHLKECGAGFLLLLVFNFKEDKQDVCILIYQSNKTENSRTSTRLRDFLFYATLKCVTFC